MFNEFLYATLETLLLVFLPGILSVILGGALGILLYLVNPKSSFPIYENNLAYQVLNILVNITRSIPFVILMIAIIPFTRLIAGTTIGTLAACVPLTIAAIPFFARITESAFLEIPKGVIDTALSFGASNIQVLFNFNLIEARNHIIYGIILMLVTLVGYSAMAGTLAGGGLGAMAFNYGYQRFQMQTMVITVVIMIILVQVIEYIGNKLLHKLSNN
tara:strand:+ start:22978 stop:23628 length:651 start_codon:yes stop_codon:yes gene_type:complete